MSDIEEPPSKVTKYQMESQYLEGEVEEGQEEWLSEGILTDDDYNPAAEQDRSGNTSQDEPMASFNDNSIENQDNTTDSQGNSQDSQENVSQDKTEDSSQQVSQDTINETDTSTTNFNNSNIEETLNNFENSQNTSQDLPDDLDAYLIRKTQIKPVTQAEEKHEDKTKQVQAPQKSEDDGNDTDDLLRLLGDGEDKKKKILTKTKGDKHRDDNSTDDDDEFIFEGANMKTLKVASKALMQKYSAAKAVMEDDDITDASSDEADTMKRMFGVKDKVTPKPVQPRQYSGKSSTAAKTATTAVQQRNQNKTATPPSHVDKKPMPIKQANRVTSTPLRTYTNRKLVADAQRSLLKPDVAKKPEPDEIIDEDEFTEGDNIDLNEEFTNQSKPETVQEKQRIMQPEQMDEEVPTDYESETDEESLYDELPSSDSEAPEEWFTLDIRAERAGEYIPLLGNKAHQLLSEEKERVAARLETLKTCLSTLTDSGKQQAAQLQKATLTLAELDTLLAAT